MNRQTETETWKAFQTKHETDVSPTRTHQAVKSIDTEMLNWMATIRVIHNEHGRPIGLMNLADGQITQL